MIHALRKGPASVLDVRISSWVPDLIDSGNSQQITLEFSTFPSDKTFIAIPQRGVRVVFSKCNAWQCRRAEKVSGSIQVSRYEKELAFQIDLRAELPRTSDVSSSYTRVFQWVRAEYRDKLEKHVLPARD